MSNNFIQPKPYMDKLRLRRVSSGGERRRNISLRILEKGTPLPKPIEYADIDNAMFEWVDKKFDLTCNGKKLPTCKLTVRKGSVNMLSLGLTWMRAEA